MYPRIHEAVGEPVGKGLKVDEPKLFTWTDLARTNTDPLVHSVYVYASSDGCRSSKRLDRMLAANSSDELYEMKFSPLSFLSPSPSLGESIIAENRGKLLKRPNVCASVKKCQRRR